MSKLLKPLVTNLLILISFVVFVELIFGYWFEKYNFGPYVREHRMKNQPSIFDYKGKIYKYNYRRNYYGFRGDDIEPSEIEAIMVGGSNVDERYKPEEFTITGYLNKNLKQNNLNIKIINAGIEAQSTVGIIYNFKHWFSKMENFSPKLILFYIGVNDTGISENVDIAESGGDGHIKNPEAFEVFLDNIKSRSLIIDSIRIFKFKYLPRKNFVKYDGNTDPNLKNNFKYINYEDAIKIYDINVLKRKYKKKISNYLSRIDILYKHSKKIDSEPVFITTVGINGYTEDIFIFNYSLILHCKLKKYNCIDVAKKLEAKYNYWRDGTHTSAEGSEVIADLITDDLIKFIN